jgi:hypothetical protein
MIWLGEAHDSPSERGIGRTRAHLRVQPNSLPASGDDRSRKRWSILSMSNFRSHDCCSRFT